MIDRQSAWWGRARRGATQLRWLVLMPMAFAGVVLLAGCQTSMVSADGSSSAVNDAPVLPDSQEESNTRRRARIRVELGANYFQQRNLPVALNELRQAQQIDPSYPQTYSMLGLIYMDMGDKARADENFQQGLRLAPDDSEMQNNYGWFLCQNGQYTQAVEHFNQALRNPLYTTPAKPLRNAGICELRRNDEKSAEAYFLRAFQVDPRDPVAMYQLSELYLKRGDLVQARKYQQRILSMYKPVPEVLWLGLRIERAAGKSDIEASYAAQLRGRFPDSKETALLLSGKYDTY